MKTLILPISIKQAGLTLLMFLISGLAFSQTLTGYSPGELNLPQNEMNGKSSDEKWPFFNLGINAVDIFVMGPIVHADFRIAEKTYIGAFYVYHSWGIFAGQLIFDKDITHSPKSMGAGISVKHYFLPDEKQNAWYCGLLLGYSYNEATYHSGYPNERIERLDDMLAFVTGGYRWNLGKKFYALTGIHFGIAYTFNDDIYSSYTLDEETGTYLKQESYYMEWPSDIYPYPMPDFTFGINF